MPLIGESAESENTENTNLPAKPSSPSSQSRDFFRKSENSSSALSASPARGDNEIQNSIAALDSLIHDMETGKAASDLHSAGEYRASMVSLSDKNLIPTPVSPRRPLRSQAVGTHKDNPAADIPDTNISASPVLPSISETKHPVQVDCRTSHYSAYSLSVYSEQSSVTSDTGAKRENTPPSEIQAEAKVLKSTSPEGAISGYTDPLDEIISGLSDLLVPIPLDPSQTTYARRKKKLVAPHKKTFLLDDSASESKSSSPRSAQPSSNLEGGARGRKHETSSEFTSSGSSGSVEGSEKLQVHPNAVNEKAARMLGLGHESPKSPLPSTPTSSLFQKPGRNSAERNWSSPRIIKSMVSRMSLTASKTSSTLADSPCSPRFSDSSSVHTRSPSSRQETLSVRKKRSALEGTKDEASADLQSITEEKSISPAASVLTKLSLTSNVGSISKRRGFRPLSVRIGEAFNPFSSRDSKPDDSGLTQKPNNPVESNRQNVSGSRTSSTKVYWANYVAKLTSKPAPDINDHPMFRADPFSVKNQEPVLQLPMPSELAYEPRTSSQSTSMIEGLVSGRKTQDVENVMIGLGLVDPHLRQNQTSSSPNVVNGMGLAHSPSSIAAYQNQSSIPSSQIQPRPASGEDHPTLQPDSSLGQETGKKTRNALPSSPSISIFKNRNRYIKALPLAQISSFGGSSFLDDDAEAKRSLGFSNIFKSKAANKPSSKGSIVVVTDGRNMRDGNASRDRLFQIQRLRTRLSAHSYDHDLADMRPRHPTTGRGWHSRNLRCTSCSESVCPCCGRACCSFRACLLTAKNDLTPMHIKEAAINDMIAINQCFPVGRESPTFIQCTHATGCGKSICPDCCGICPDECCQDVQCRKCKTHPWAKCDWHPDSDAKLKDVTQGKSTSSQHHSDGKSEERIGSHEGIGSAVKCEAGAMKS